MSYTKRIRATTWTKLYGYLVEFPRIHTGDEGKTNQLVETVFWIVRSGSSIAFAAQRIWQLQRDRCGRNPTY
ncbi:hypothetical protein QUB56_01700 [Microcoleus sp. AR_TQ3_B6]|uniref:hypothetical protein n=1 Tax=Microcoleus sp. AR_TQ3_B6 TaxID=3055284 RepID=UPI002FD6794F